VAQSQKLALADPSLRGDSPFDAFGDAGNGSLDLDYGGAAPPQRPAAKPNGQRSAPRPRKSSASAGPRRSAPRVQAKPPPSPLWIVPVLIALFLGVVLFAPSLVSAPLPETPPSTGADANGHARIEGGRHIEPMRRTKVGSRQPALRDVGF
jgi:hypothetical protein